MQPFRISKAKPTQDEQRIAKISEPYISHLKELGKMHLKSNLLSFRHGDLVRELSSMKYKQILDTNQKFGELIESAYKFIEVVEEFDQNKICAFS